MSQVDKAHPVGEKSQSIGEHVVVKSIDLVFNKGIKPSKQLDVFVEDKEKSAEWVKVDVPERTYRWRFKDGLCIFPNDKLSIRPLHSRKRPKHFTFLQRDHIDSYNILTKDIVSFCTNPGHPASSSLDESDYTGAPPGKCSKITLKVILREFSSTLVEVNTTSLNPDAKAEVLESISSSKSLQEAVSQLRSVLSVVGTNVEIIQHLENVVKTFASVHPIAQAAVSALLIPYKLLKAEHEFKKDIQSLANEIRFLLELLEDERWIAKLSSTKDAVMEIMKGIIDTSLFVNDFVNKGRFRQFSAAQIRSKLDEHVECLKKLRDNFETALNVQNAGLIAETASVVNKIAVDDNETRMRDVLEKKLKPAEQQTLRDFCLQGTRLAVLSTVEKWLKDMSRPNVLWISGAPGAGKSTISATIVKMLEFNCVRFFVKRGATSELRDPRCIWRTIAFALADMHSNIKVDILEVVRERREYPKDAEVGDQFRNLLKEPIQKHAESFPVHRPFVVIIDALDECRTSDKDWSDFLETLVGWSNLPSNVKLIVTSRNEKDIRDHLQTVSERIVLETGSDTSDETSNDIRLFFRSRFEKMRVPENSWPGEKIIIQLTKHAAGLFIWAKTVVEFVGHKNWHPPRRLKIICDNMDRGSSDIDALYGHVLYETFSEMEDQELNVAKFVLAAVSLGKAPLAIQDLVELLAPEGGAQMDEANSVVQLAVEAFSPIINVRSPHQLLSVCHKTLSDFLTNETRMQDVITQVLERAQKPVDDRNLLRYTMRCSEQNARLAEACLRLMNRKLKFNICRIPTSHCFNEAIHDRDALVKEHVPHILLYACQYWAEHLNAMDEKTSKKKDTILCALKVFLETHILHWLEVLSLTGSMGCVFFSLSCAERYTKTRDDTLSELARDARQFTATFHQVIDCSAPHIYISALPFAPSESKVAQVYGPRHPNTLSVLTGRLPGRSEMLPVAEMLGHSNYITCLAYLPDTKRLASGSSDHTIRIWDAHSGRAIAGAVLQHSGLVLALSPSPNGDKLASLCRDGAFRVWDLNDNQCTYNVKLEVVQSEDYSFCIEEGEISSDWENCAAAFHNQPYKFWGTKDEHLEGSMKTKAKEHGQLKFLINGTSLICASDTDSIVIQNTKRWELDGIPIATGLGERMCLAVSADGKLFASGHDDGEVRLYDYRERRPLGNPMRVHRLPVTCIEFTADSSLLVSGSNDNTLCFWDTKTQRLIGGPHRIFSITEALSFSPDGSQLAVAVRETIKVFDIESCIGIREVERPSIPNSCIAFDKRRRRFASGTYFGVVRIWDAYSGQMVAEWTDDSDSEEITSLAFVQDSNVIAFSSRSGHIRKWDWKTGQLYRDLVIEDLRDDFYTHAVSPNGRHIAFDFTGEAHYISLWDVDTDREVRRFVIMSNGRLTLVFSPDGELIAFRTSECKMEIWRVAFIADVGERPICSFEWDSRAVTSIVFSPDAKQLAFCTTGDSEETQLHIWDIETRSEPKLLWKSRFLTDYLSFSLGGDIIVASSSDGTTQFLNVSTGESIGEVYTDSFAAAELLNNGTLISVNCWGNMKLWDVGLDGRLPRLLQSVETQDTSNAVEVSIVEGSSSVPPRRDVQENRDKSTSASLDSTSVSYPAFFDGMGTPTIGDRTYIDHLMETMGWVRNRCANGEKFDDDPILFWLPHANRCGFWWPRNTAIMDPDVDPPVTRIDFSRFVHGENWHLSGEPDLPKKHDE